MRYIKLDDPSLVMLKELHKNHTNFVMRRRAQILLFSHKGLSINKIGELLDLERKAVAQCFDTWEADGLMGLYSKKGRGAKPIFTKEDKEKIKTIIKKNPRKIDMASIEAQTGKKASKTTIKRILKSTNMIWKRVRQSLKGKRDEAAFQAAKQELKSLQALENEGAVDLYYFDECGFSTVSNVPYAWQEIGENILLPTARCKSFNVAGFMKRDNTLETYCCDGSINSKMVVAFFDDFCKQIKANYKQNNVNKIAYIIIDNAPIHTSKLFCNKIKDWEKEGNIIIKRLPTYSPELNLIEILWRFVKYDWLPFEAYQSRENLVTNIVDIFSNFGTKKYTINFV